MDSQQSNPTTVEGWYAIKVYLGVSDRTARSYWARGLLPCVRKNRASGRVFARESLLEICKQAIDDGEARYTSGQRPRSNTQRRA